MAKSTHARHSQPQANRRPPRTSHPCAERRHSRQPHRLIEIRPESTELPFGYNPYVTAEYYPAYIEGPRSPESVRSTGSYHYASSVASSYVTGTTAELERQRQISPVVATPTSSNSSIVFASQDYNNFQTHLNPNYYNQALHSTAAFSPITDAATLAGIDAQQSFPPTHHLIRRPEYIAENGPYPSSHQRYPQIREPWTGLPLRHEDPMLLDTSMAQLNATGHDATLSPSLSSPESFGKGTGKRNGPLSPEQRRKANGVRLCGACLRCTYMKEPCDRGYPCNNCSNKKARKWRGGCRREHLDNYVHYLLPSILISKLEREEVNRFTDKQAFWYCDTPHFKIRLDMGLGRPLEVFVKELEPLGLDGMSRRGYLVVSSQGKTQSEVIDIHSPPIALYLENQERDSHRIRQQIRVWAQQVLVDKTNEWPWPCFGGNEDDWLGHVLKLIHEYHDPTIPEHKCLSDALYLPFFNYIMIHYFEIPESDVSFLYRKLRNWNTGGSVPTGPVSPSSISRFIKMLLLRPVQAAAKKTLEDLHALLNNIALGKSGGVANTDLAFCLAFITLLYLGGTQTAVLAQARSSEKDPSCPFSFQQAHDLIREMESELADYVVYFHAYAYGRRRPPGPPGPAEAHAARFGFMQRVKDLSQELAHLAPRSVEIGEIDPNYFAVENTNRLCWKLFQALGDS